MINGALPTLADTDVADTLGAGADLSFEPGGVVPDAGTSWERDPVQAQAPDQTVPVPRRAPVREPEVPGRAPDALQPHPEDVAEGRLPTPAAEDTTWERDQPTLGEKLRTGARAFARGVIPNVSSIPAGVAGFGAGSVAGAGLGGAGLAAAGIMGGPIAWGGISLAALLGGLGVGGAAAGLQAAGSRSIQDTLVPPSATEQAEAERNPGAATAGSIAAGGVGLSPYSGAKTIMGQIAARGGQAAAQGGMDVGQQMAEGRPFDWHEAAGAAGLGALLPGFNRLGRGMTSLGEEGHAPAPQPAPAPGEPPIPLAVPVGKPYGPESTGYSPATPPNMGVDINGVPNPIGPQATPRASNQNAPFVPPEGPRATGNDNMPGVKPGQWGANENAPQSSANDNYNFPTQDNTPGSARPTQDNTPGGARPQPAQTAQPDFAMQGAPDFTLNGGPEGSQAPRGPGSSEMPLSGDILPPGAPDPWSSPQLGAQQIASLEGPQRPTQGAPSGGPGLPPPGQRSPGGGPPEGPYVKGQPFEGSDRFASNDNGQVSRSIPGRPDTTPDVPGPTPSPDNDNQWNTPAPGGYPGQSAGAAVPTKGARAVNVAPPPRPGLTPKSMALIARSKSEAATSQPTKVSIGTASENPPPPTSHQTIGNDTSAPFADRNEPGNANGRGYAKTQNALGNEHSVANATTDDGTGFTPDVAAALTDRLATVRPRFNANDNSQTPGKPGRSVSAAAQREAAFQRTPGTEPAQERAPANDQHPVAPETKSAGPAPTSGREVSTQMYPEKPAFHDALLQAGYQHDEVPGADGRTYHRYQNEPARAQAEAAAPGTAAPGRRSRTSNKDRTPGQISDEESIARYKKLAKGNILAKVAAAEGEEAPEQTAAAPEAAEPEHPAMAQLRQARQALQERGATRALQELDDGVNNGTVTPAHVEQLARVLADTRAPRDVVAEAKERGQLGEPRPSEYEEPTEPPAVDTRARTDTGAIANSETTARKKNFAAQTADNILQEHKGDLTKTPTPGALRDRISGAMRAYREEMARAGQSTAIPIKGNLSPGQKWLARGAALLRGKLDPARIHSFMTDEFSALHPELGDLTGETDRIEGGIAKSRTTGEDAVRTTEHANARTEPVQEEYADWGKGRNPDEDTGETRGREENPEHKGWSLIDPEDEESRGFTDRELSDMHDRQRLERNLNRVDHEAHQRSNGPTQRQRFNTERPLAERMAEVDPTHIGTPEQRRQAIELMKGPPEESALARFFGDESGKFDPDKVHESFVKNVDHLGNLWQKTIGDVWVPARQGKMGSDERALARITEAVFGKTLSWAGQKMLHARNLLDGNYRAFDKVDKEWDPKTDRKGYILNRNLDFFHKFEHGIEQATPWLRAADKMFRRLLKETFDAEKLEGAGTFWRDNYMAHMFKTQAEAERYNDWMTKRYGPSWFTKHRGFDDYAEAVRNGFEMKYTNPAEVVTQRMIAGISMMTKMRALHDMERFGNAYPTDAEEPLALKENGWQEIVAPNNEKWLISPESWPMWKNAIDREGDLWLRQDKMGAGFRGWMAIKAVWVPWKLAFSGFHLGHIAFMHVVNGWNMGAAYNGEKTTNFKMPKDFGGVVGGARGAARNIGQLFTYPAAAISRNTLEPIARTANAFLKAQGNDRFQPVVDGLEWLGRLSHGARAMDAFNDPNFNRTPEDDYNNNLMHEMGLQASSHMAAEIKAMQQLGRAAGMRNPGGMLGKAPLLVDRFVPLQRTMFHLIQMWKTSQALHAASDFLHQHPEYVNDDATRLPAMREIGKNIDDRYGEAFSSAKLWHKLYEGVGRMFFLSMDWQTGQVNQFGGAVTNTARSVGAATGAMPARNAVEQAIFNASPKATFSAQYLGSSMLLAGLMTYGLAGEFPDGLDYVYPRSGGINPDGSPRRITMPQWGLSEGVRAQKHWGARGRTTMGAVGAAGELLWSKGVVAPAMHALTNRDFYNREMSNPDADLFTRIGQHLMSVYNEMTPIAYESSNQIESSGGTTRDKLLAYAGMPPAPKYVENSDVKNQISRDFYEGPGAGVKLYGEKERDDDKHRLMQAYDLARIQNRQGEVTKLRAEIIKKGYEKPGTVGKHPAGSGDQYMFERLARPKQLARLESMNDADFRRYVTKNSYLTPGDAATRELTTEWKKTHPYWRG